MFKIAKSQPLVERLIFFYQSCFNLEIGVTCGYDHFHFKKTNINMPMLKRMSLRHLCIGAYFKSDKSYRLSTIICI